MRCSFAVSLFGLAVVAAASAGAHEGHKMECNQTSLNAMNADIQAMPDGEAKTTAKKEIQMAGDMMAKHDMDGCETHMDSAMEAMEK
jgi:hypothetical protein